MGRGGRRERGVRTPTVAEVACGTRAVATRRPEGSSVHSVRGMRARPSAPRGSGAARAHFRKTAPSARSAAGSSDPALLTAAPDSPRAASARPAAPPSAPSAPAAIPPAPPSPPPPVTWREAASKISGPIAKEAKEEGVPRKPLIEEEGEEEEEG